DEYKAKSGARSTRFSPIDRSAPGENRELGHSPVHLVLPRLAQAHEAGSARWEGDGRWRHERVQQGALDGDGDDVARPAQLPRFTIDRGLDREVARKL